MHPTSIYRMFDDEGVLVYVGISSNMDRRLKAHRSDKSWWRSVHTIRLEHFDLRHEAEDAERTAIRTEGPLYNIVHARRGPIAPRPPERQEALIKSWYSVGEIALATKRSEEVVRRAIGDGRIPAEKVGKRYRVSGIVAEALANGSRSIDDPCPVCGDPGPWFSGHSRAMHVRAHEIRDCPECGKSFTATGVTSHRVTMHEYRKALAG